MRILFYSGSIGLGHVTRDLALAAQLRRLLPDVAIDWLAAPPARQALENAGETVLPQACQLVSLSTEAESAAQASRLNLISYLARARRKWRQNVGLVLEALHARPYDCVIGDETYEIAAARGLGRMAATFPFVMMYDFVGLEATSLNPLERLAVWSSSRKWVRYFSADLSLFVGEPEDVPDNRFGFLLPNRRAFARAHYRFVGYILPFDPADLADRSRLRGELGYGSEPLIICSIGGTAVGKELLELGARSLPRIRERAPAARMILVCGPRLDPASLAAPDGCEVRGYVPELHRHLAACDLAIVQAGGATTLELTALRRPFLYFPLEGHCEQEGTIASRLARHCAGERLTLSETTPDHLAARALAWLGREVDYAAIPADGARVAAETMAAWLSSPALGGPPKAGPPAPPGGAEAIE